MPSIVDNIYPPVQLSPWWTVGAVSLFVGVVGGYFVVRWLRVRFALRKQQRLAAVQKPHKAEIIQKALQEIARIRSQVESGSLPPPQGAQELSLAVRRPFDLLMNHRTVYAAKYEVAARSLTTLLAMLDAAYPVEFSQPKPHDPAAFAALCDKAVTVVQSCN